MNIPSKGAGEREMQRGTSAREPGTNGDIRLRVDKNIVLLDGTM